MRRNGFLWTGIVTVLGMLAGLVLVSCTGAGSQSPSFYDAGANDATLTSAQFSQYVLFRFDTSSGPHTLTLPDAAGIVSAVTSPVNGEVLIFGVTADGGNPVAVRGGNNVIVRPSAASVSGNTTLTIYYVLNNTSSGFEVVTLY